MPYEYVPPAGLVLRDPGAPPLEERYEVVWRDDEDPPHYFFWAQVSALRLERFLAEAFRLLPARVQVVLEVRRTDEALTADPDGPTLDRWASGPVARERLLRVWEQHGAALVHDGSVGFGAYDPDSPLEVFLDDHKLLSVFAPALEPLDALFRRYGVPEGRGFGTILDVAHDHRTLAEIRDRDSAARRVWTRRRGHDVAWFAPAIRKSFRMRLQETPAADEGATDESQ